MEISSNSSSLGNAAAALQKTASAAESPVAIRPTAASVEAETEVQQPVAVPNPNQVAQAVKTLNQNLQPQNLEFSIDEDTDRVVVKITDRETGKLLRQLPSEEALHMARVFEQMGIGKLINEKA